MEVTPWMEVPFLTIPTTMESDAVDSDDDGDGVLDSEDWALLDGTEWADSDADGVGDNPMMMTK